MTMTERHSKQQAELHAKLWKMVNSLRSSMEPHEFKNYILGILFYKFLSEKVEDQVNEMLSEDDIKTYEEAWATEEYREALIADITEKFGYVIAPEYLFRNLVKAIEVGRFDIELLGKAINSLTDSTSGHESNEAFDGLFEDMDLNSTKLGKEVKKRSKLMSEIIVTVDSIDFEHRDMAIDVLGDAYEYLIGMFASTAGKKAGEYFSPPEISVLLSKLSVNGISEARTVHDPTAGSGSLLLKVSDEVKVGQYYFQEVTSTTFNLCRMNLLLHGVDYNRFHGRNADTLENPQFMDMKFDIQVANPPYSVKWSADPRFLDDERFSGYGKLAPASKGDFAFVQHMIHHMADDGRIAVVLPHGVLFRGASEGAIRKHIIKELNYLDAVIGLPSGLFFGTSIPVAILVLKKNRGENKDNVLFIDASKDFEAGKNQNRLREDDIYKIVDAYKERKDIDKYAHVATLDEIRENDYNLNIPRYVDTFEVEAKIDILEVQREIDSVDAKIAQTGEELKKFFKELGLEVQ